MIDSFHGTYRFLSNFYLTPITYEGLTYNSVEHAYQAAKTLDPEIREGFAQLRSASVAKKIGSLVPKREDWPTVAVPIMRELLALKFAGDTGCARHLVLTYPQVLIEGNTHHDRFWGRCNCDTHDGTGENWLGTLLMEQRETLWAQLHKT